jgi:uncharacterized caspase-like protein
MWRWFILPATARPFGDTPYVAPVDAEFSSLGQMPYELVPVETLIGALRQAKGVRIAILDACRDNATEQALKPQSSRGGAVTGGLAPIRNPSGLIIAYATQYVSTAADDVARASGHSPFTTALLNNIATPGLDVTDMLRKVGREVDAATRGKQRPESPNRRPASGLGGRLPPNHYTLYPRAQRRSPRKYQELS